MTIVVGKDMATGNYAKSYYTLHNFYIYFCFQNVIQGTKKSHILNFMNKHIPIMTSISTKNLICIRQ